MRFGQSKLRVIVSCVDEWMDRRWYTIIYIKSWMGVYVTFYFILQRIIFNIKYYLGQYINIKFLPMLLYIFQMRWKKFNIKIYPWITLHIITFLLTLLFAFCVYFWSCIYATISLYSHYSISTGTNESNF